MKYNIDKKKRKQVSFYSDVDTVKKFQELFPHCLTLCLNRFLTACVNHPELFEDVFFNRYK